MRDCTVKQQIQEMCEGEKLCNDMAAEEMKEGEGFLETKEEAQL